MRVDPVISESYHRDFPLSPDALTAALGPFGESTMLPAAAYIDAAVFSWEQQHFFGGGWVCAGLSEQIPLPGDQRAEELGVGSVLLVRGDDGVLRGFANTCRHRGHELLPCGARTRRAAIVCPYHSWTYTLAGRLRAAAGFSQQASAAGEHANFIPENWSLLELPTVEWHGLVFVNSSGRALPLTDALQTLEDLVAPYEPERLSVAARQDYETAANWKVLTENYHECYHCPVIHPELCRVSPPRSGVNYSAPGIWVGGRMDLRDGTATMSLDGASHGAVLRGLHGDALRTVLYVNIVPNVLMSLHPDYVMVHRLVPIAVDKTRIECSWAFAPEAIARPGFDPAYAVTFWDVTNRQDWDACESVQRGLASPHAAPGPLSPQEDAVYQFVTMIARGYLGQPLWNLAADR
jgi:glycine betaine catabolism A